MSRRCLRPAKCPTIIPWWRRSAARPLLPPRLRPPPEHGEVVANPPVGEALLERPAAHQEIETAPPQAKRFGDCAQSIDDAIACAANFQPRRQVDARFVFEPCRSRARPQ